MRCWQRMVTAMSASWHLPCQPGAGLLNVADRLPHWFSALGHGKVSLRSDQEPAITDLQPLTREERRKSLEEVVGLGGLLGGLEDEN